MRFSLSQEQAMFRDTARDLFHKHCPPAAVRAAWNEPTGRVPGLWARLAEVGIAGMTVPEAHGGLGMNELDLVPVLEEAGRAAAPEPLLETTAVGAPLLRDAGSPALCEQWLPRVVSGEVVLAVCLGRPGGPEPVHTSFADEARLILVQVGDEIHAVPRTKADVFAPQLSVDGSRRLFSLAFRPSEATRIASGEQARRAVEAAFDRAALAASAELCGLARRMLDMTVEHVNVRHQFGKPVGSFQAVKHHLASALVELEMARPVVLRAGYSYAHGDPERSLHVSMAKARASDAARAVAKAALQCHGAIGYTVEYDLHLYMKRAWALAREWGDAAWHRARAGRAIFGEGGA